MVVDFTATWCGPCKFFEPTMIELASKFPDVIFVKIDVDELPELANEFRVTAIPAFVLIKEGKEIDKVVGVNKEALQMKIEKRRL
ncbi:Thioredoxin [Macleaya cordata]|uniref:Thioredoxin n=1 Tax=Macleaya cordata TaxID=56857 RepID=A0A200QNI4_MACCD|nr:Thioredoxin [Macleaya cordata]